MTFRRNSANLVPWLVLVAAIVPANLLGADRPAPPAWADPQMPVKSGLALWLDAGRQPAARQTSGGGPLFDGAAFDVWYDASGLGRNLAQRSQAAQPRWKQSAEAAVVRFDGKDDCLELSGWNRALETFTLFIVAAPRSNPGGFRGLVAANETGKNDYTSGFTVDLSWLASPLVDQINIEGKGFGGAANLLQGAYPFGEFHAYEVFCQPGTGGVQLAVDGKNLGRRDRTNGKLQLDDLTVGARFYSNSAEPAFLQGFFEGDLAEILLFERGLSETERQSVQKYLAAKYEGFSRKFAVSADGRPTKPLKSVSPAPAVQMFVPGFAVRELPVDLTNINNLRYRPDGKLVALAYDGNVYLLRDTDQDGLEDSAELFWDNAGRIRAPIGMTLTPPGYAHGQGLFVAGQGKVSLVVDTDNDDRADREFIVAEGWTPVSGTHGVDALGVALATDGSIYFGLGTGDYTNAYRVDAQGKSQYDLKSERGTILKVSPDFKRREIVATGIRFPVALAFNRQGDLFATDQEGATWLPNGNPFDELLQILPGRHYGFPPKHPRFLPDVIDEPSVFDYKPQHQSTCGLCFNEPAANGTHFGPPGWKGNALVAGYSRGKLYRTELVPSKAGYIARNHLLGSVNGLPSDMGISPRGDLVVAVHGGGPDWGSGPQGKGKLYQIRATEPSAPQPVFAWPVSPRELRIAFDRPLDPAALGALSKEISIEYGKFVGAGDRFEALRPGYAVVGMQQAAPRYPLEIQSVQVSPDRRTVIVLTEPAVELAAYAITLPRPEAASSLKGSLPQISTSELGYELTGVLADWESASGETVGPVWLPHLDLKVAHALTAGSAEHEAFWKKMTAPGKLRLRTRLDLVDLLRPAVQPGSRLDYELPKERAQILFRGTDISIAQKTAGDVTQVRADGQSGWALSLPEGLAEPVDISVELPTKTSIPILEAVWSTAEDPRDRPFPLTRILVPWGVKTIPTQSPAKQEIPELAGGNWKRGRELFFGEQAKCGRCHIVGGRGGRVGPDLSNLIHRDYESVLRDVRQPNASINPDHVAFVAELKSGQLLTGLVRREPGKIIISDQEARDHVIDEADIEALTPASVSIMPEGIDKQIDAEKLRDLLTFLLTEPLNPAPLEHPGAPPARAAAEVAAVLEKAAPVAASDRRVHIVLCTGPKDHGPGEHDYPLWRRRWVKLFDLADNVLVTEAEGWPSDEQWSDAETVVFYSNNPGWSAARAKQLDTFLARGGGLVYIHYAVDGHQAVSELAQRIGLAWQGGKSKFRHGALDLNFPQADHPITRGLSTLHFEDESYWDLVGDPREIQVLATGDEEGRPQPLMWSRESGGGRVFVSILGHYNWTFDDPLFRLILLRGIAWTAREPADRFNSLVYPGANVQNAR